ncbi:IS5 family transposase [Telmatocola sphagniphila]|uniref:IS5 family transposase n=1 Tax=Telmatocola sphagniphila TaxID=1123043 RepID=UPI001FEC7F34|nr:IS5 family transposase [Telmatocola sphagniphila]
MERKPYSTDLTDAQWALLEPWIPEARPGGRPRKTDMREVVNALFYLTREGCRWRGLPHDFPPWKTVYNYFEAWKRDGTWEEILTALRCRVRQAANRSPNPRVACIDSQSVKTAFGGEEVGTDGGKKVRGRKRHIVVDTLGLLLALVVTGANVDDAKAAQTLFEQMPKTAFPRLETIQADNKYHNYQLQSWLRDHKRPYTVWVVNRPSGERKFMPLRSRWVVERTFAWLGRCRRLSKDYEHLPESSEAIVQIACIQHYLRRLYPSRVKHTQRFRYKGHTPKTLAA